MRWFGKQQQDLIEPQALADYGRFHMLGAELSGLADYDAATALIEPLRSRLYSDQTQSEEVKAEIRRHAGSGEWGAVGAWKFAFNCGPDGEFEREMTDLALVALSRMQITNLAIHLGIGMIERYTELTGSRPQNDGFFAPPVFDSHFGPTRQYYYDQATTAKAARRPTRVPADMSRAPGDVSPAVGVMWDFGMLVLRGPLLVASDLRFEPSVINPAVAAATNTNHAEFSQRLHQALTASAAQDFHGWSLMGGARFLEDYLDPALTGTPHHVELIDLGLAQLTAKGILGTTVSPGALSAIEKGRL